MTFPTHLYCTVRLNIHRVTKVNTLNEFLQMKSRNSTETKTFEIVMEVLISFIFRSLVRFRDRFNRRTTAYSHSISVHHAFHWLGNEHECNHVFFPSLLCEIPQLYGQRREENMKRIHFSKDFHFELILTLKQTEPGSSNSNNTCQITLRPLKFTANVCVCVRFRIYKQWKQP